MSNSPSPRLLLVAMALILTACSRPDESAPVVEIRRAELAPAPGLTAVAPRDSETGYVRGEVYVHDVVEFTDADFARAALAKDNLGNPAVMLDMTGAAAARLETVTRAHLRKPLAITVRGELVAAPIVVSPLSRAMMITGLSADEAGALVEELNAR